MTRFRLTHVKKSELELSHIIMTQVISSKVILTNLQAFILWEEINKISL